MTFEHGGDRDGWRRIPPAPSRVHRLDEAATADDVPVAGCFTGFPEVPFGTGRLAAGESAWRAARLTPPERTAVLWVLGQRALLVAREPGRRRTRAWIARRRLAPNPIESRNARRARLGRALLCIGDDMRGELVDALDPVPDPVADYATELVFAVVGRHTAGWTSPPFPPGRRVIVLAGDRANFRTVVRHELGHAWNAPDELPVAPSVADEEDARRLVAAHGLVAEVDAILDEEETLARLCELAWSVAP